MKNKIRTWINKERELFAIVSGGLLYACHLLFINIRDDKTELGGYMWMILFDKQRGGLPNPINQFPTKVSTQNGSSLGQYSIYTWHIRDQDHLYSVFYFLYILEQNF